EAENFSNAGDLIEFCLSEKSSKRPFTIGSGPQEYTILSPSQDLRTIGPVPPTQDPTTNRNVFGFAVGWGIPFIQVAKFKDRLFLRNGYHRVYAIRNKGVKHVPCILIEIDSIGELGLKQGFFEEGLLMSNRPPVFADFFSAGVSVTVRMKSFTKIVRI